ncbi:MAG: choice-of-anchor I family protein, partial [Acidimicrobiia bacterium]
LQENNAIAVLDLDALDVVRIDPLGWKDHSLAGNGLDGSDQDGGIVIAPWANVRGMYQPDALAAFEIDGHPFVLSANEGDAREYDGLVEAARLRSVTTDESFGPARANNQIGRLNVTTSPPASSAPQSTVYAFGARSFSVWDGETGSLTYDSGDALEQTVAAALPTRFNANNTSSTFDNRSDDKGPEPEAAAVAVVDGTTYGFIGLERVGGIVAVDLDEPTAPSIVQYLNNRSFDGGAVGPDRGPEVIDIVDGADSPTGRTLVVVANEITGTVSIYTT